MVLSISEESRPVHLIVVGLIIIIIIYRMDAPNCFSFLYFSFTSSLDYKQYDRRMYLKVIFLYIQLRSPLTLTPEGKSYRLLMGNLNTYPVLSQWFISFNFFYITSVKYTINVAAFTNLQVVIWQKFLNNNVLGQLSTFSIQ